MTTTIESPSLAVLAAARTTLPSFLADPQDLNHSGGNVSMCIIDGNGEVHGAMFGQAKLKSRDTYQVAWRKANQVWLSGYPTGRYEELVYSKEVDINASGLMHPELLGWEGGWPVIVNGIEIAVAVSGMRGESDSALVFASIKAVGGVVKSF
jgi:uncharacterized protein GlcG (DUF336 family)